MRQTVVDREEPDRNIAHHLYCHATKPDKHERSELRILTHAEDHFDPGHHLLHQEAVDAGARLIGSPRRAAIFSAAARTAPASQRPSVTPPTSVLWLASAETIFAATGKPMSVASAAASSGVLPSALLGILSPCANERQMDAAAFSRLSGTPARGSAIAPEPRRSAAA